MCSKKLVSFIISSLLFSTTGAFLGGCSAEIAAEFSSSDFEGDEAGECSDGADNDRNGLFDCNDPNCEGSGACDSMTDGADVNAGTEQVTDRNTDTNVDGDDPADTGASNPADTGASNPADTGASNPADTGASNPADTGASNPADTGTSNPSDTGASNPEDTGASNPEDTGASNPEDTGASNPEDTGTSNPVDTGTGNGSDTGDETDSGQNTDTNTVVSIDGINGSGILIDHTSVDLDNLTEAVTDIPKDLLRIRYQHTSHGSQLMTGMHALKTFPAFGDRFAAERDGGEGILDMHDAIDGGPSDLSTGDSIDGNGVTPWVTATRNLLGTPYAGHINVIMWSWCSINGHDAQRYVDNMEVLISEYPEVAFVFMTGHSEGQGENLDTNSVHYNNQLIRQHCAQNNRILFDFADIEAHDPAGNYYWDMDMRDNLDYSGGNWAAEWISANSGDVLEQLTTGNGVDGFSGTSGCAHSDSPSEANLNCVLKGIAAWQLYVEIGEVAADILADN